MNNSFTTIQFPSLGIEIDPSRSFPLGSFTIYFYGIIIACGLLLAVVYAWKRAKAFGIKGDDVTDGVLWITPLAIICARIYYVVFSWSEYADDPVTALYIWKGGLAIYGAVIGAVIGVAIHCRAKKIKLTAFLDLLALGLLIGQCIGRWGNFFNREAFGSETDSFLRMGLYNTLTGSFEYYHPTFLYESLWNAVGFVALHFLSRKRKYDGQIALGYLAWYGLGRAIIEPLREDSLYWGNVRVSQVLAAITCFAGVFLLMLQAMKKHDPAKLYVNVVAREEAALEVSQEVVEEIPEEPVAEPVEEPAEAPAEESAEEAAE